jgi:hypothetical protein
MADLQAALATQLSNIEARTGRSLDQLCALAKGCGLAKHGEIRAWLQQQLGLGYGDANTLAHVARQAAAPAAPGGAGRADASHVSPMSAGSAGAAGSAASGGSGAPAAADPLATIYTGPKAALRPLHERIVAAVDAFGPYETAPKKGYVSLRRKKQFAMVGPATQTSIEIGLNAKALPADPRLKPQAPGGMCAYKLRLSAPDEVDAALVGWLHAAYDAAG